MAWKQTPQGYALTTAVITQAGGVEYYGHEIGMSGADRNKKIKIVRTIEELSKEDTLKSFEGLPLTLTHPIDGEVTALDHKQKAVGHIQNVRIDGNSVVCDVYITDAAAIKALQDIEVREVSVGYEIAEIVKKGSELHHVNIRGNHVAVVAEGRYGSQVRLNDKKGKAMKFNLTDVIKLLKSKKLNDSNDVTLTKEEIENLISSLEEQLEEMKAAGIDSADEKMQAIIDELERLKAEREEVKPTDEEPVAVDDKDAKIAELTAKNEQLLAEIERLKKELEEIKGESEKAAVMNDAKASFPKVKLTDAKTAKEVRATILKSTGVFNDSQINEMTDSEIRAAYAAAKVTLKARSNFGNILLNDSKIKERKPASSRLGGKK